MGCYGLYVGVCSLCVKKLHDNGQHTYTGQRASLTGPGTGLQFEFGDLDHYREHGLVPREGGDSVAPFCSSCGSFLQVVGYATLVPLFHAGTIGTVVLKQDVAPVVHANPFQQEGTNGRRISPTPNTHTHTHIRHV